MTDIHQTPPGDPGRVRRLGRYELVRPLATGGMATVYLGRAAGIGGFERLVAIKVCHPHLSGDAEFASMFLDEARLAARIHHPNVVSTLDVGQDGELFHVMEYLEGVTLAEWLKALGGGLPLGLALRVMVDALAGLHAAHELRDGDGTLMNLVHRDVSPQNILVGSDGVTRIVDFGIAKAEARTTVTRGREIKGKLGYMPPEQFLGQPVTRQTDIYAAGVVLWEALSGKRLFVADSDAAVMNLVLRGEVPSLATLIPGVTAELDAVVARALSRKAQDRFLSAAEFSGAIEQAGVPVATGRDVAAAINTRFSGWLSERRALAEQVRTRAPGQVPLGQQPTLVARLLEGRVLLVPRWQAGVAVLAIPLLLFAAWQLARPHERDSDRRRDDAPAAPPPASHPAPAAAEAPGQSPAQDAAAPDTPKPSRLPPRRRTTKSGKPERGTKARPIEYRPREL